ncbi:phosphinothricin acetyltransferase [Loktanella ponticola]|uniref:Phosphinothricin acetyltransferase n=1 Tax=Yoonia ponticola TaxID=1524255 RepID=A0A7W9BIG6_9RHOB|nr:GNAT family N-acetyltransferase [Yoonia ponticola]MBB5720872.1 phosphinothricin acetyltransferase [Yoonia ponticola]
MIRQATAADAPMVAEIMNHVIANTTATFTTITKSVNQVATEITSPQPCLVAEIDGTVCGYARYFPFRSGPGYAHVAEYSIALSASTQGRGVGRQLLSQLCDMARADGKTQLIGAVSSDNETALKFHETNGFSQVGRLPDAGLKWDKPLDLIFMQKRL